MDVRIPLLTYVLKGTEKAYIQKILLNLRIDYFAI